MSVPTDQTLALTVGTAVASWVACLMVTLDVRGLAGLLAVAVGHPRRRRLLRVAAGLLVAVPACAPLLAG